MVPVGKDATENLVFKFPISSMHDIKDETGNHVPFSSSHVPFTDSRAILVHSRAIHRIDPFSAGRKMVRKRNKKESANPAVLDLQHLHLSTVCWENSHLIYAIR